MHNKGLYIIVYVFLIVLPLSFASIETIKINSLSNSMYPTINQTSKVWINETNKVRLGDIISFNDPDGTALIKGNTQIKYITIHRIIGIRVNNGEVSYLTKGDNNPYDDCKVFFNCKITKDMIIGKVFKVE